MGTVSQLLLELSNTSQNMNRFFAFAVFATLATVSLAGHYHGRGRAKAVPAPTMNIVEIAVGDARFSTLVAAVKAADLVDTLAGAGPFTVLAPTNDAFAKIPADTLNGLLADKAALTKVLLRHVIPAKVLSRQVGNGQVATAGGEKITTKRTYKGIKVASASGQANVILADVLATNGVIHAIDSVI